MHILIWILRVLVVLLLVWFAAKNAELVTLNGFGGALRAPLALVLLAFFGAGLLLGLLSALYSIFRLKREIRSLNRALQQKSRGDTALGGASTAPPVAGGASASPSGSGG